MTSQKMCSSGILNTCNNIKEGCVSIIEDALLQHYGGCVTRTLWRMCY